MTDQTEREAMVQTIASDLAMSYGSHVNAPKGGRDWRAAENLLGVLEHLGLRRIDPDDEALVGRCADVAESHGFVHILGGGSPCGCDCGERFATRRAWREHVARAALKAALA